MNKHELLKSIGFSEEYIDHLRNVEEGDKYIVENPVVEYTSNSIDVTNILIEKPTTSFSTTIESSRTTTPTRRSSRR